MPPYSNEINVYFFVATLVQLCHFPIPIFPSPFLPWIFVLFRYIYIYRSHSLPAFVELCYE